MAISVNLTTADQTARTLIVTKVSAAKLTSAATLQKGSLIVVINLIAAKLSTVASMRNPSQGRFDCNDPKFKFSKIFNCSRYSQ